MLNNDGQGKPSHRVALKPGTLQAKENRVLKKQDPPLFHISVRLHFRYQYKQ